MAQKGSQIVALWLGVLALLCWAVMFAAGTDVWHDVGRPDFWNLAGPPYQDLRAFAFAFYLLFAILSIHLVVTAGALVRGRRRRAEGA